MDDRHTSPDTINVMGTLPRTRYHATPQRDPSILGYGDYRNNTANFAKSPRHQKLQSLPTIAKKYLSIAQKQSEDVVVQDEESTYLRAIERGDIEEVREILETYDLRDEFGDSTGSSDDDDTTGDDDSGTAISGRVLPTVQVTAEEESGPSSSSNGPLRASRRDEAEISVTIEMQHLENRPSKVSPNLQPKMKSTKFQNLVNNSVRAINGNAKKRNVLPFQTDQKKPEGKNLQVFDKNCRDQWGRTGLFIATSRRNIDMIELLLKYEVYIGECLYHAVDFGYYDVVELLLKYDQVRDQVITGEDSFYPPGLTPIQLAAHKNDFIMLKILYNNGFRIMAERGSEHGKKRVFSRKTKSEDNQAQKNNYYLLERAWDQSNDRMLYYRAMSSPAYLIMMHTEGGFAEEPQQTDFLGRLFLLYDKLKKKSRQEPDVRSMYLQLADQVEDFSCDLLNEVRSAEDLSAMLRFDAPGHIRTTLPKNHLLPLQRACDVHMKNFVAHQHCQLTLSIIRVGTIFASDGGWKTLLVRLLLALIFPILSIAFIVAPNSGFGSLLRNPIVNLSCHIMSDITFLALMVMRLILKTKATEDCLQEGFSSYDAIILSWILGRTVNEIKRLREGKLTSMLQNVWKLNDLATLSLFYVVIILKIVDRFRPVGDGIDMCDRSTWDLDSAWPLLVSEGCMSFIYLLIFVRAMEMMYIDRTFGPLQLSLDKMLLDVLRFSVSFFAFTFFAFACGMTQLYWAYGESLWCSTKNDSCEANVYSRIENTMLTQFWTIFGYGYTSDDPPEALEIKNGDGTVTKDVMKFTEYAGTFFSGLYHCWAVIVMLNMVIAMMSHSFDRVRDNAEVEWKYHRTNTWMKFIRKNVYPRPPPMNLIPSARDVMSVCRSIKRLVMRCTGQRNRTASQRRRLEHNIATAQDNGLESLRYRRAIDKVTSRYLRKHLLEEFQHDEDSQMLLQGKRNKNDMSRSNSSLASLG